MERLRSAARSVLIVVAAFTLAAQTTISIDPVAASPAPEDAVNPGDSIDSGPASGSHAAAGGTTALASSYAFQPSVSISDGGANTRRTNAGSCAGETCHDLVYNIQDISKPYTLECWFYGRNSQKTYDGRSWRGSWSGRATYGCYRYASYCGTIYVQVNGVRSNTISINQSVPDAPGRPSVSAGNRQVSVSWSAPSSNCAAIGSYEVRWRRSGGSSWSSQTTSGRSYTMRGLADGTSYEVRVRARNSRGWGSLSPSASATTQHLQPSASAPGQVSRPSVSTAVQGSLSVSWSAPSSNGAVIDRYSVRWRRSRTSAWSDRERSSRSYTISGLRDGTAYEVQVRARNSEGWGSWSSSGSETTNQPVVQSSVSISDGGLNTRRTDAGSCAGEICHDLVYDIDGISEPYTLECWFYGRNSQRTYDGRSWSGSWSGRAGYGCYRYASYCGTIYVTVNGVRSNTISTNQSVPDAPGRPSVSAGTRQVSVSWSAPSSNCAAISSYEVQWRRSGGSSWSSQTTSGRSYTISSLADGTSYEVRVRARNSRGWGSWSRTEYETTQVSVSAPGRVARPQVVAGAGSMSVSWNAPSDGGAPVTDYDVRWGFLNNANWSDWEPSIVSTSRSTTIPGLTAGTDFKVSVRARNSVGAGPWSDLAWGTPTASVSVPGRVAQPSVTAGVGSLTVSWSAPSSNGAAVDRYEVRWRRSGGSWSQLATTSTGHAISGLRDGTAYEVQVRARNSAGWGSWSSSASETTSEPEAQSSVPEEVTRGSVAAGDGSLTFTWDAPSDGGAPIVDYDVRWRSVGSSNWAHWEPWVTSTLRRATITGLTAGTAYELQVRARNSVGAGPWTESVGGMPTATESVPDKVTGLSVVPGDGSLSVSWLAPSSNGAAVDRYEVRWRLPGGSWSQLATTSTGHTISGLADGTTYEVQVRARNSAGWGSWSRTANGTTQVSVSTPDKVTGVSVTAGVGSLTVSWSAPSSNGAAVDRYEVRWRLPGGSWSQLATTSTGHAISGLRDGTAYEVQVRARNSAGWGSWSSSASETSNQPETQSSVSISDGGVNTRRTDAGSCAGETCHDLVYDISGTSSPYTLECWFYGRNSQRTYSGRSWSGIWSGRADYGCFRYASYCGTIHVKVNGVTSNAISINQSVPGAPGRPSVSAANQQVSVSWSAPSLSCEAISSYEVRWRRSGSSSWSSRTTSDQSYTISGLAGATDYEVQVRARNSLGWGSWSQPATPTESSSVPAKVAGLSVVPGAGSLTLSWHVPDDAGSPILDYDVQYRDGTPWMYWAGAFVDTSPRATITGLLDGHRVAVRVRARNSAGPGAWSDSVWGTPSLSEPGKVTGLSVAAGPSGSHGVGSLVVTWNPPTSGARIVEYQVFHNRALYFGGAWLTCESNCGPPPFPLVVSNSPQVTIDGLTTRTPYLVSVRAVYSSGPGEWSNAAQGVPISVPDKATDLSVRLIGKNLVGSWDAPADGGASIEHYVVGYYVGDAVDNFRRLSPSIVNTGWRAEIDTADLNFGNLLHVVVAAKNSAGFGEWSEPVSVATPKPPPDPPTLSTVSLNKVEPRRYCFDELFWSWGCRSRKGVRIEWQTVAGATGYDIVYWYRAPRGEIEEETPSVTELEAKANGDLDVVRVSEIALASEMICNNKRNTIMSSSNRSWDSTETGNNPPGCRGKIASFRHISGGDTTEFNFEELSKEDTLEFEFVIRAVAKDDSGQSTAGKWSKPSSVAQFRLPDNCRSVSGDLQRISVLTSVGSLLAGDGNDVLYMKNIAKLGFHVVDVLKELKCGDLKDVFLAVLQALPGPVGILVKSVAVLTKVVGEAADQLSRLKFCYPFISGLRLPDEPFVACGKLYGGLPVEPRTPQ